MPSHNRTRTWAALALALAAAGCKKAETETAAGALAVVGGTPITEESFRYWWDRQPPSADTPAQRQALLEKLIGRTTVANRARAAGLDRDPAVVEAVESLLIATLRERDLQPKLAGLEVGEAEARARYDSLPEQFVGEEMRHVALLWFDTRGQSPLEARYTQRLERVRESLALDAASGFGALALTNSEHRASRHKGGDLGWIPAQPGPAANAFHTAVAEIAASLTEPGQLSEVVAREEGLFLVRLIEHRAPQRAAFEDMRPRIERDLLRAAREKAVAAFEDAAAAGAEVTRFPGRLAGLSGLETREATAGPRFHVSASQ